MVPSPLSLSFSHMLLLLTGLSVCSPCALTNATVLRSFPGPPGWTILSLPHIHLTLFFGFSVPLSKLILTEDIENWTSLSSMPLPIP